MDLRSVQGLRDVQMTCDEPVEQREHDEVEHDRDDHFMRAESGFEIRGHRANDSPCAASRNDAKHQRDDERRSDRKCETNQCCRESTRCELTLASDIEQSGAETER